MKSQSSCHSVVQLHGFAGHPSDFHSLDLPGALPQFQFYTPDLYSQQWKFGVCPLSEAVDQLVHQIEQQKLEKPWIVGYSMGGRLGLNALMRYPDLFQGGVLMAAGSGVFDSEMQNQRRQWEKEWHDLFKSGEREAVVEKWNQQSIFLNSQGNSLRPDLCLSQLAENLQLWSPTQHLFEPSDLHHLPDALLWVCGEQDQKYSQIYQQLKANKVPGQYFQAPRQGHRLLQANDGVIKELVIQFLQSARMARV